MLVAWLITLVLGVACGVFALWCWNDRARLIRDAEVMRAAVACYGKSPALTKRLEFVARKPKNRRK